MHNRRHIRQFAKRNNVSTNKIVDRLTYSPKKHKMKTVRAMRQKLQAKALPPPKPPSARTTLKIGSFNVNGLDLEVGWTIQQLLQTREYDVSMILYFIKIPQNKIKM